jgi:PAS domain S-box-containing protein
MLAVITLVAAATQGLSWLLGGGAAGLAGLMLIAIFVGFAMADLLDTRERTAAAVLVTSFTIMLAIPITAALFDPGLVALLMAPIAFILAVPHLRGRLLAAVGVAGVVLAAIAAALHRLRISPPGPVGPTTVEICVTMLAVAAVAAVLFVLAWQADRAREAARSRVQALLAGLPVGFARADPDGRLVEVNEAFARMYDYPTPASMAGVRIPDLVAGDESLAWIGAELDGAREVVSRAACLRRDGSPLWVRFTVRAVRDDAGSIRWYDTVVEDISAERRTLDEKARLAAIVDTAELTIVSVDLDGRIVAWNGGAERLFGWTDRDAEFTVFDVSPPDQWEWIRSNHARAAQGETLGPFEVERTYNGRTLHLAVTVFPLRDADGRVTSIANVGRDVTADVLLRAERARLEAQLREAQRLEAIGRLAGGIAHDFNNQLTVIRGLGAELVEELEPGSSAAEAAEQILRSSAQASELTRELLAFARRQVLQPEAIDLDALIADQVPALRLVAGAAIELVVDGADTPPLVLADRGQLVDVLLHLVVNAREAMPAGGTIRVRTRVAPSAERPDAAPDGEAVARVAPNEVILSVEDTGPGIAPDSVAHVFEPFYTTKEMGHGAGLGLAKVHGIVRQSGGRIEVATSPGGTAMIIRLPLSQAMPAPAPARTGDAIDRDAAGRTVDGARILLVDDDAVVRTIARRALCGGGFEVIEAADAAQARTLLESAAAPVDLLVTDVIMPGMRGPELARLAREAQPDLPVLFVSGYAGEGALAGLEPGHAAFVAKPFAVDELVDAARELLRDRPPRTAASGAHDAVRDVPGS